MRHYLRKALACQSDKEPSRSDKVPSRPGVLPGGWGYGVEQEHDTLHIHRSMHRATCHETEIV